MVKTKHKHTMNPGSITMLFYRKVKVLTIVGAFFVAPNTVSVLSRNHCPESENHCPDRSRIYMLCFKSEYETGNLQGVI